MPWKIGLPLLTSTGPPPIASANPPQPGERESRASTFCPTFASALSCAVDWDPRATSLAAPKIFRIARSVRPGSHERVVFHTAAGAGGVYGLEVKIEQPGSGQYALSLTKAG